MLAFFFFLFPSLLGKYVNVKENPELLEKESQRDASLMCHMRKSEDGDAQVKNVLIGFM